MSDIEQQIQEVEREEDMLRAAAEYTGDDQIVTSVEHQKVLDAQPRYPSIYTKIPSLDKACEGFRPGELIIVSGPTGQGKTTFLQTLTYSFAEQEVTPLWFSFEVSAADLFERFGSRLPYFTLPQQNKEGTAWLAAKIWEAKAKYNAQVVFVDHLHFLLSFADLAKANTSVVVGAIIRDVKRIAIETRTTIFLVSHIKKIADIEKPSINDLRDSSFIAQESDFVLMTYRVKESDKYTNQNMLIIEKNRRTGSLESIRLVYDKPIGRFREFGTVSPGPITPLIDLTPDKNHYDA